MKVRLQGLLKMTKYTTKGKEKMFSTPHTNIATKKGHIIYEKQAVKCVTAINHESGTYGISSLHTVSFKQVLNLSSSNLPHGNSVALIVALESILP